MAAQHLVFTHRQTRYAFDLDAVQQIVWLPALSPLEESPPSFVGVFSLHGRVVPVMDLCVRFDHARKPYRLSNQVIVISGDHGVVGVIADEVLGLVASPVQAHSSSAAHNEARFVSGEVAHDQGLAMVLDTPALLRCGPPQEALDGECAECSAEWLAQLYGELSASERDTLQARTQALDCVVTEAAHAEARGHVVFRLNNEYFALDHDGVREFVHLRDLVPLPCCPAHIVGNMNLRGDILTLVDLRPVLGVPAPAGPAEVVVVQLGELHFGLRVDEIAEVSVLSVLQAAPLSQATTPALQGYSQGLARCGERLVCLLDLAALVAARQLHAVRPQAHSPQ